MGCASGAAVVFFVVIPVVSGCGVDALRSCVCVCVHSEVILFSNKRRRKNKKTKTKIYIFFLRFSCTRDIPRPNDNVQYVPLSLLRYSAKDIVGRGMAGSSDFY